MADATKLQESIKKVLAYDKNRLVSRTDWGSINFSAAATDLDAIFEIALLLNDLPVERLPASAVSSIANALDSAASWLERNDKFDLNNGGTPASRDEIVNNLKNQHENLYSNIHVWVPFLAYLKGDIPEQLNRITGSVEQAERARDEFKVFSTEQRGEIEAIVKATREAAAEAGVGSFTEDFLRDSDEREVDAKRWLTRSTWSAVMSLVVAISFFFVHPPQNQYSMVQYAISKVVILAMLIGITAWCAGNYKANMHQAAVSRFKAHALKTFQAFVQASENEAIKDAVLLETTRSIFAHAQSGYLKGEASTDGTPRILEIIKNATGVGAHSGT